MTISKKFSFYFITLIALLFFCVNTANWARLYVQTWSSAIVKMLCPVQIPVWIYHNGGTSENSSSVTAWLEYNSGDIKIGKVTNTNYNTFVEDVASWFIFNNWLYSIIYNNTGIDPFFKVSASNNPFAHLVWDLTIGNLTIQSYDVVKTDTTISINYNPFPSLYSSIWWWTWSNQSWSPYEILNATWWVTFSFITGTCQPDTAAPYAQTFIPNTNGTTKIYSTSGLSLYLRDDQYDYPNSQPGYLSDVLTLSNANYKIWQAGRNLGIHTWTISFTVKGNGRNYNWGTPVIVNAWTVNILSWITKTRDRFWRDYYVAITGLPSYGIEKAMIFSWSFSDRAGNTASFIHYFNNPVNPWLSNQSPANWAVSILPKTDILVKVSDDRAGVNSGSLSVTIQSGWCAGTTLYTFTWASLHLNSVVGSADFPDYWINIASWDINLPIPYVPICVTVSGNDLSWNPISPNTWTFTTRWSCNSLEWCMNPLEVYFSRNSILTTYTGAILYATWASGIYPYVGNGSFSGTLFCWPTFSFTGFLLTGNITTGYGTRYTGYNGNPRLNFSWGTAQVVGNEITIFPF